ncbi:solute carrier family 22 member 7 isoform X5 [Choloepus didactylus]|uniref:solute carrier family 22 member 7 isoform X5 n=1 Tax=Choloepus didactylus TaxID=27675 RepID=UPI00189D0E37|nr:solute carrier family 22 member 7 isoform X5 [Choloepus didactylus]
MAFEELLDQVGGFGPFQLRNVALLALPRVLLPLHFLLPIFLAAVPAHHCALPSAPANISHQDAPGNISHQDMWLEAHLPREPDGTLSSCLRFVHARPLPNTTLGEEGHSHGEPEGEPPTVPCPQGWEYDRSEFSSTIATEWDLVCEQKGLNRATSTFFFAGVLVWAAPPIAGGICEYPGDGPGVCSLELEWLDVGHRTVAGVLSSTFWTVGVILLALVGYLIRDWRWLLLAVTLPCAPGILSLWWVPESARWLLTQGRVEEAHVYLLRCARINGQPVGDNGLSQERRGDPERAMCPAEDTKPSLMSQPHLLYQALNKVAIGERVAHKPSYLDLFRTPRLRHISLCCMVVWFGVNFSYYGLSLNVSGLGLNVYQTQLLFGAVELPSKLLVYLSVRHAGRRLTQAGSLLGTAVTVGIRLLVSSEMGSWSTALAVMGKGFSEAAFTTAYLFTSELYPTVLRQTGMGLTALVGRLGGSLAPLAALLDGVWLPLPKLTYGGIALLAACTALLLPETRQIQLPETIQDVERRSSFLPSAVSNLQEEEMPMKQVQN